MRTMYAFFGSLAAFSLILVNTFANYCDLCRECDSCVQGGWAEVRHREPNGIGYSPGYSTLEAFYAPDAGEFDYPFLNFRAHIFNNGNPAFNTGVGIRHLFECNCSNNVVGANIYWDYRQAKHAAFNQIGAGLEWFSPRWDFHLNGYFPVGRHKKSYRKGFDHFAGNRAFFFKKYELAMIGTDAQLGYLFYTSDLLDFRGAIGGYTFHSDFSKHASGGLLKVDVRVTDYIVAEGQVSYDNHFKWIGQGELGLRFPFGREIKLCNRNLNSCDLNALERKLASSPDRFEIIVATHHKKRRTAIDSVTGLPLNFIFVNNTSSSNGTFESPYPTLALAQANSKPGDVIYVFPGDGTTTGYNGIILKDNQMLIGSGFVFPVTTPFGVLDIPAQTTTSPTISVAGNIITLANNNRIRGLNVNAVNNNIAIRGSNIINAQIEHNIFTLAGGGGGAEVAVIEFCGGAISIVNNIVQGSSGASLIFINPTQNSQIFASSNISTSLGAVALDFFITGGAIHSIDVVNNFTSNTFSDGIRVQNNASNANLLNVMIRDNTVRMGASALEAINVFTQVNGSFTSATIKNNVLNKPLTLQTAGGSPTLNTKIANNVAPGCDLTNNSGTFQVQSPNLALSGVQTINQFATPITTSGTIQFVPINQY